MNRSSKIAAAILIAMWLWFFWTAVTAAQGMFMTITVSLCKADVCVEEIVTDSDKDDSLTLQSCMLGQPMIAKWIAEHPRYRQGYRVERWRCVPGKYQPRIAS